MSNVAVPKNDGLRSQEEPEKDGRPSCAVVFARLCTRRLDQIRQDWLKSTRGLVMRKVPIGVRKHTWLRPKGMDRAET